MTPQAYRNHGGLNASSCEGESNPTSAEYQFSARYQQRKQALIKEFDSASLYAKHNERVYAAHASQTSSYSPKGSNRFRWRVAAIIAATMLIVVPASAFAAINHTDFFTAAFGNDVRTSVDTHQEVQGYKNGSPFYATYPTREYTDIDLEKAEQLLGDYTYNEEIVVPVGDHTLTVLSAVRDKDTLVMHFTLERSGGVTALEWSEFTNQGKGALQPNDAPYKWFFTWGIDDKWKAELSSFYSSASASDTSSEHSSVEQSGNTTIDNHVFENYGADFILVDPEQSTEDKLSCYAYIIFNTTLADDAALSLHVHQRDEDGFWSGQGEGCQIVEIPVGQPVPGRVFNAEGVGQIELSPLSLVFAHTGDGDIVDEQIEKALFDKHDLASMETFEEYLDNCYSARGIDAVRKIVVNYKDGSTYTVFDDLDYIHNTANSSGRLNNDTVCMFNRLVDPQEIESITVNDVTFL